MRPVVKKNMIAMSMATARLSDVVPTPPPAIVAAAPVYKEPLVRTELTAAHFASYVIQAISDAKLFGYLWADLSYGQVTQETWREGMEILLQQAVKNMMSLRLDKAASAKARDSLLSLTTLPTVPSFWRAINSILNNPEVKAYYNI